MELRVTRKSLEKTVEEMASMIIHGLNHNNIKYATQSTGDLMGLFRTACNSDVMNKRLQQRFYGELSRIQDECDEDGTRIDALRDTIAEFLDEIDPSKSEGIEGDSEAQAHLLDGDLEMVNQLLAEAYTNLRQITKIIEECTNTKEEETT